MRVSTLQSCSFALTVVLSGGFFVFFFFNDTATTEIYTLSLHDALPIFDGPAARAGPHCRRLPRQPRRRSEEHTSELQSQSNLVCRLLLEKKNTNTIILGTILNMFTTNVNALVVRLL